MNMFNELVIVKLLNEIINLMLMLLSLFSLYIPPFNIVLIFIPCLYNYYKSEAIIVLDWEVKIFWAQVVSCLTTKQLTTIEETTA